MIRNIITYATHTAFLFAVMIAGFLALTTGQSSVVSAQTVTECNLWVTGSVSQVNQGESVEINWSTSGFDTVTINGETQAQTSGSMTVSNIQVSTLFTLQAETADGSSTCTQSVFISCIPVPPPTCTLTPENQTVSSGESANFTWTTTNADSVTITDLGSVALNGSGSVGPLTSSAIYTLTATGPGGTVTCGANVAVADIPPAPTCTLTPATQAVMSGESASFTWTTDNATSVTLTDFGSVALDGTNTTAPLFVDKEYVLTAVGPTGQVSCTATVDVTTEPPAPTCTLTPATQTVTSGGTAVLTWTTTNASTVTLTDFGTVANNGTVTTAPLQTASTYELIATGNGKTVSCVADVAIQSVPAPVCDSFTANPSSIMVGASSTLNWETSNATQVFLNNGVGTVDPDGSIQVSPLADIVYELTLIGEDNQTASCTVPVTVSEDPVPVCDVFTATPNSLPFGGGSVSLNWEVSDATNVTIAPTIGSVGLTGTQSTAVTQSTTFTLTATDDDGDEVSCVAPVTVADPGPALTCADNVSFTASDTSITQGSNTTLTWSTTDVDTVSISSINATTLSGSQTVTPADDITYTLTATRGSESVSCPLSIAVSSGGGGGGGGGGSASPRCELTISDTKISLGDRITLEWDTSRATEVTLTDDRGEVIFTTDDFLASEKADYYDGSIRLTPTRDTEYFLLAERGSRDEECTVEVEIDDSVVVLQSRDQQPLVAGISLSQVPYTGFEAGPVLTIFFYVLLVVWSLFITYLLVVRKRTAGTNGSLDDITLVEPTKSVDLSEMAEEPKIVRPNVVAASVNAPAKTAQVVPNNLPTENPVVGYENQIEKTETTPHQADDAVVTTLENRAHQQKALLSSDAIRHFIGTTNGAVERNEALDQVIAEAKKMYPLEDGWIVINETRMRNLCEECQTDTTETAPVTSTVPEGAGSLAEAIVTGNVVAAYQMIGNRPMFALADAAADLDAVYRNRRGDTVKTSQLLKTETERLSDEQVKEMITALTGALDGTYTSEEEAVKMAIMKAVKVAA